MRRYSILMAAVLAISSLAMAGEDPTVVDPDHYSVVFENDEVRVLRITYGPGEESVMHYHADGVAVFLTDHQVEFTMSDGTSQVVESTAGEAAWAPGGDHLPKNLGGEALEVILVELKEEDDDDGDADDADDG